MYSISEITKGVIFELLPFNDKIQSFELRGSAILKALERGVSSAWELKPFKGPYVLQVSGNPIVNINYYLSLFWFLYVYKTDMATWTRLLYL